jgi:hypothetical protein
MEDGAHVVGVVEERAGCTEQRGERPDPEDGAQRAWSSCASGSTDSSEPARIPFERPSDRTSIARLSNPEAHEAFQPALATTEGLARLSAIGVHACLHRGSGSQVELAKASTAASSALAAIEMRTSSLRAQRR